jgi:acetyl esterase
MIKIDVTRHLDPEMAAAVAESARLYAEIVTERGPVAPDDLAGQRASYNHERAFWNAIKPALAAVEPLEIPGPGGVIPCRLYRPSNARPLPALVYFHGGGWAIDTHDQIQPPAGGESGAVVGRRLSPGANAVPPPMTMRSRRRASAARGAALGIDGARLALGAFRRR